MTTLTMFEPVDVMFANLGGPRNRGTAWQLAPGLLVGRPMDDLAQLHDVWVVVHRNSGLWLAPAWTEPEAAVAAALELVDQDFTGDDAPWNDVIRDWLHRHSKATGELTAGVAVRCDV